MIEYDLNKFRKIICYLFMSLSIVWFVSVVYLKCNFYTSVFLMCICFLLLMIILLEPWYESYFMRKEKAD